MSKALLPKIDLDLCIGCGACVASCPYSVIEMDGDFAKVVRPADCRQVKDCVTACPVSAITMEELEYDDSGLKS
ncbi:MAG: 4Fe-4S binding protein [Armatimonadetes bacterium]|nr:4Fe-4S binding protein [Armatimonadota bacterium]